MAAKWKGNYFDGKSAASQKVEIQHVSEGILIEFADGRMRVWRSYEFRLKQDRSRTDKAGVRRIPSRNN